MKIDRAQRWLIGLLAAQVVLLVIVRWPFARAGAASGQALLPRLASISPERIEIADGDGATLTLERRSGSWVLGRPEGYPVGAGKVEKVIQDLVHLTAGRPVASDTTSHAALKVARDQFERRVRVWGAPSGPPAAELFVGSSPGYGVTHVRVGGSDRVFEASGLSAYDIPTDPGAWIDRALVPFPADSVAALDVTNRKGAFSIANVDGAWRVRSPAARSGAALDQDKVRDLVRALSGISPDQPAGPVGEADLGLADPEATVRLARGPSTGASTASEVTIRFGAAVAGKPDSRYAMRAGAAYAVTVPKYAFDRALDADLKDLMKK